jgi:hypothetical protein
VILPFDTSRCSWDDRHVPPGPAFPVESFLTHFLLGLAWNHDPSDLSFPIGRITGVSHWCLDPPYILGVQFSSHKDFQALYSRHRDPSLECFHLPKLRLIPEKQ